ncbi:MAG: hypothetical protein NZ898_03405 [Myxococcota bacterium]|nr:hypothetical protein [Myxococcota bacterium]
MLALPTLLLVACASGAWLAACGGRQTAPEPAWLRVIAEPPTARVWIDEELAGIARVLAVRPARLQPGVHIVTIDAPGHFPHDLRLDLAPGVTTVRVRLRPVPP